MYFSLAFSMYQGTEVLKNALFLVFFKLQKLGIFGRS